MITKEEFLQQLRSISSEVRKQEFLEKILKQPLSNEVKITALSALAEIFVNRKMFGSAAKNYCYAGDLANTFREKMELYFKGALLYLKADDYVNADDFFRKVLVLATTKDRETIKQKIINLYFEHANNYEKEKRYNKAITAFNRMLMMNLPSQQASEIKKRLAALYEKIGKAIEANQIRAEIERSMSERKVEVEKQITAEDLL